VWSLFSCVSTASLDGRSWYYPSVTHLSPWLGCRFDRTGAIHADTRESMAVMQANIGAVQANLGAIHADTRDSIEAIGLHADIGAIHADTRDSIGLKVIHADIGAVGAAQVETRGVLETVIHVG